MLGKSGQQHQIDVVVKMGPSCVPRLMVGLLHAAFSQLSSVPSWHSSGRIGGEQEDVKPKAVCDRANLLQRQAKGRPCLLPRQSPPNRHLFNLGGVRENPWESCQKLRHRLDCKQLQTRSKGRACSCAPLALRFSTLHRPTTRAAVARINPPSPSMNWIVMGTCLATILCGAQSA